jgi:hypothetical protein
MGLVQAAPALRRRFIREAAGLTGDVPRLENGTAGPRERSERFRGRRRPNHHRLEMRQRPVVVRIFPSVRKFGTAVESNSYSSFVPSFIWVKLTVSPMAPSPRRDAPASD